MAPKQLATELGTGVVRHLLSTTCNCKETKIKRNPKSKTQLRVCKTNPTILISSKSFRRPCLDKFGDFDREMFLVPKNLQQRPSSGPPQIPQFPPFLLGEKMTFPSPPLLRNHPQILHQSHRLRRRHHQRSASVALGFFRKERPKSYRSQ